MEYAWIALTTLAQIAPPGAFAPPQAEWRSAYTEIASECLPGGEFTAEAECKSFGGYRLVITGAGPELSWRGRDLPRPAPAGAHAFAGDRVEWRYRRVSEPGREPRVDYRGFIYQLRVEEAFAPAYFAVRLDGAESCALGERRSEAEARRLVEESREGCAPSPTAEPSV